MVDMLQVLKQLLLACTIGCLEEEDCKKLEALTREAISTYNEIRDSDELVEVLGIAYLSFIDKLYRKAIKRGCFE